MTHYLNQLGYQVDLVDDSLTAIENIQSKTYDLIIKDINLHGSISGEKFIHIIRESEFNVGTPLIVWTAYTNKNDEEKYLAWGADAALVKWCSDKLLENTIQQCFLKTRFYRKLYYQLKNLKEKCEHFINEAEKLKGSECINQFKFSLHEALLSIEEYHKWLNFRGNKAKEEKTQIIQ
jgi:CheY-like chemotaxis protein